MKGSFPSLWFQTFVFSASRRMSVYGPRSKGREAGTWCNLRSRFLGIEFSGNCLILICLDRTDLGCPP